MELVGSIKDVTKSTKAFNEGLKGSDKLIKNLSTFKVWYYVPGIKMVAPSKFVGYKDMTVTKYDTATDLNGTETEGKLKTLFRELDQGSTERTHVEDIVQKLLTKYNKKPNAKIRVCAPPSWDIGDKKTSASSRGKNSKGKDKDDNSMVEVFWRAYQTLYPEDKKILAERIAKDNKSK